jgi:hypothetical protein
MLIIKLQKRHLDQSEPLSDGGDGITQSPDMVRCDGGFFRASEAEYDFFDKLDISRLVSKDWAVQGISTLLPFKGRHKIVEGATSVDVQSTLTAPKLIIRQGISQQRSEV